MNTAPEAKSVDYNRVRLSVKAAYDRYHIDNLKSAARFKELRVRGKGSKENEWLYTARGKETRRATTSGGGCPLGSAPRYLATWFRATPCENLPDDEKLLLNYFYNANCPRELDTYKTLYGRLWIAYRERLKSKKRDVKPKVMSACYDMLGEILHRSRRCWVHGGKFRDFDHDDVIADGDGVSRQAWYATYRDHWFNLRRFVEREDERCLDLVRSKEGFC